MSTFSTSTPAKKTQTPSPDDSGVSIQLSELGEGDQESDKMLTEGSDSIKGEKEMEITLEIDDGEQWRLMMVSNITDISLTLIHVCMYSFRWGAMNLLY